MDELKHWHITQYRDTLLAQGLHPNSIRKHNNILNAMINMAFKHLDIDRLSPFRGLKIKGEGENIRPIPPITPDKLELVKNRLVRLNTSASLVGLIQLNTGTGVELIFTFKIAFTLGTTYSSRAGWYRKKICSLEFERIQNFVIEVAYKIWELRWTLGGNFEPHFLLQIKLI
ncbi:MAG: hypothetical protein WAO82_07990 [Limnohabitans sp.]